MRRRLEVQMLRIERDAAEARCDAAEANVEALSAELNRAHRAIRFALGDLQPGIEPHGTLSDLLPPECPDVTA